MKRKLLCGGSVHVALSAVGMMGLAGVPPGEAAAQTPEVSQQDSGAQARNSTEASAEFGLDEIVVTARRREESLQDTPISISAFTGGELESRGITRIDQVAEIAPNVVIRSAGSINASSASASFFIRGIGQSDFLHNTDPGVGVYVDGVYVARSIGGLLDVLDVERVEVLRGPQGTLFGKNTIGGAVNITTQRPHDEFEGNIAVTTGSFERIDVSGAMNVPIGDGVYAHISGNYQNRDSYVENLTPGAPGVGDIDSLSGRMALRVEPSEVLTVDLAVDGTRRRENPSTFVLVGYDLTSPFLAAGSGGMFNDQFLAGPFATYGTYQTPSAVAQSLMDFPLGPRSNIDILGANLTIEYDLGPAALKSISAVRSVRSTASADEDHSPFHVASIFADWKDDFYSQEVQLSGSTDSLEWVAGAYYSAERGAMGEVVSTSLVGIYSGGKTSIDSLAVFSQATYDLTDRLSLTGGLRWTEDKKQFRPDQFIFESLLPPIPVGTRLLPLQTVERSFTETIPYVSIALEPTEDFMLYASYSEGFKSGGFGQRIFPPLPAIPSFEPETATVYEIGAKSTFFGNRVRLNGAAFRTDYEDLQVNVLAAGNLTLTTENAAEAIIEGFELELSALPVERLELQAAIGHLDARYKWLDPTAVVAGLALSQKFVNTPEWTASLSGSYRFELGGLGSLTPRVDWYYSSEVEHSVLNEPLHHQPDYSLLNASLTFRDPDERYEIVLAGRNVTDKEYIVAGHTNATLGIAENAYARPAEWSLMLRWRF